MTVEATAAEPATTDSSGLRVLRPRVEHHRVPMGIGEAKPRLSWQTQAPRDWVQHSYEIRVSGIEGEGISPRVHSSESVLVPWPFPVLESRARRTVQIRVWGTDGTSSDWSEPLSLEAGLLDPDDWIAKAVAPDWEEDHDVDLPPPLMRKSFQASSPVASARLYVTAHGLYEMEINGTRVGDEALAPGWTSYNQRLRYSTYDVTGLLNDGENVVGAWMADGWYRGRIGYHGGTRNIYGEKLALIAQLEITYGNGTRETIATDETWKASLGPITMASLYDGERYDARLEKTGWSQAGYSDERWSAVRIMDRDAATLQAPPGPPVRCTEEVTPQRIWTSSSGKTLIDFGQNLVGRLRVNVQGNAGETVTLRHAEVLQQGELYIRPLRFAAATDEYTIADASETTWEPRFTIHGFRYAEVSGAVGAVDLESVVARVYHTDMERTGWFESSDPLLNRLHENVLWSMRGNFVSIPTDCPQRDERLGWTGDIQVFAPTASYLYDCSGMLAGWLQDLAGEQHPDGTVPWYIPWVEVQGGWDASVPGAVWGDAAVLTPWTLYERFNDLGVLAVQYPSAKAWVDLMAERAGDTYLWDKGFQLGDWLDPAAPPEDPADARTDKYLVATAYFAWSARHLSLTAGVLGKTEDENRYALLADKVKEAFAANYILPDGTMTSDAQTAYSLALVFDLMPTKNQRRRAADRLAALVAEAGNRIATGFAGTPAISDALTMGGHADTAYDLLLEKDCPSWLYAVIEGATTIWERWDSQRPDGTVNPGEMTSFNHYALGAVADWMHRTIGGLAPAAPGYRKISVRPRPGGGLTHARVRHLTPYGPAEVAWKIRGTQLVVDATIPTGTSAVVDLPGAQPREVGSGSHRFSVVLD
ncbi:glycoside hydrolase family 78 protein [Arthrobacter sp. ISL-48]|uniref:glycoside hydrolase family 78 protein n=1 Tax=Arthrobacter sp. ISL-48 TaxID=2819110 RepID=UPI001BEB845B|nr:glycoside hydrolase family 78 protein [Arthrobacter sp. ISL-48]MBT2533171.1 glycoside hydrolase family 78 protein [Arthrobacter sp. ISL-48]